jgi:CBS domain containing-hemolysin-like protein
LTESALVFLGLLAILALDLLTAAASATLSNASLAHLLAYSKPDEPRLVRVASLLRLPWRPQAAVDLAWMVWRILLALGVFIFTASQPWISPLLTAGGITLLTALVVFWLEWLVRDGVEQNPDAALLRLARFIQATNLVIGPIAGLPHALTASEHDSDETGTMVDELKTLVDAGQRDGLLEQGEQRMLRSIFELGSTLSREIMVPRIDILALDVSTSLPEAVDVLLRTGHTRVPVFQDNVDNILGVLYAKDLLRVWREGDTSGSLKDLLRPAYFIPEAKKVDELLAELQSRRVHMAMVVDEYGGIAGLVTLEDIVEEIVGEIQDEYDSTEESPYLVSEDGEYIFQGRVDLDDFNEVLGSHLSKDEAETIGGFVYSRIGRVPTTGESVEVDDLLLTVEQVSGRRIRKVRIRRVDSSSQENKEQTSDADE